jgi:hypothetical protein
MEYLIVFSVAAMMHSVCLGSRGENSNIVVVLVPKTLAVFWTPELNSLTGRNTSGINE